MVEARSLSSLKDEYKTTPMGLRDDFAKRLEGVRVKFDGEIHGVTNNEDASLGILVWQTDSTLVISFAVKEADHRALLTVPEGLRCVLGGPQGRDRFLLSVAASPEVHVGVHQRHPTYTYASLLAWHVLIRMPWRRRSGLVQVRVGGPFLLYTQVVGGSIPSPPTSPTLRRSHRANIRATGDVSRSQRVAVSVPTRSCRLSAPAGWARFTGPGTRASAAMSR
jgi:hypothetical protein